jgi:hypothetical protein
VYVPGIAVTATVSPYGIEGDRPRTNAITADIANKTIATKKMIFAASIAKPAMPPNPSTAAISATTRNVMAQLNMISSIR